MRSGNCAHRLTGVLFVSVCFGVLALAPLESAGNADMPKGFALLVGVSDYSPECGYGDLTYSHKDARDVYDLLVDHFGWNPACIVLLQNESASAENITNGISWLAEECSKTQATGLFFFSGHGSYFCDQHSIPDRDEPVDECVVPYDGNTQTAQNMIFDDVMKEALQAFWRADVVMILDSCYSGGFIDETGADGRLILTSCGEREQCWEGAETGKVQIQNGVFTYCLLEAFSGVGDLDGNGEVSVEEAGSYAMDRVKEFTPDVQPEMYDGVDGDVCF